MDNSSTFSDSFCGEYRVKHILIKPKIAQTMSIEEKNNADKDALDLAKKLIVKLESGENWSKLVKQYSDDKISKLRDGLIQNFIRGYVDDGIYTTVIQLKDGRYARNPIKTSEGYHIVLRVKKNNSLSEEESKDEEKDDKNGEKQEKDNENHVESNHAGTTFTSRMNAMRPFGNTSSGSQNNISTNASNSIGMHNNLSPEQFSNIQNLSNSGKLSNNPNQNVGVGDTGRNQANQSGMNGNPSLANENQKITPNLDIDASSKQSDSVSAKVGIPTEKPDDANPNIDIELSNARIKHVRGNDESGTSDIIESKEKFDTGAEYRHKPMPLQSPFQNSKDAQLLQSRIQRSNRFEFNNNRNQNDILPDGIDDDVNSEEYANSHHQRPITENRPIVADDVTSDEEGDLSGLASFLLKRRKYLIFIGVSIFLILVPLLFVMDEDGESRESKEKNDYLYSDGTEEDLYKFLKKSGLCKNDDECSSSQAAKFYQKLKEVLNSNPNLTKYEAEVFIMKFIQYDREKDEVFEAIDEIEYIADIIGSSGKFSIDNTDKYEEAFTREDGYFMTYRKNDLWNGQTENTQLTRAKIYNEIVKDSKTSIEKYELEKKKENSVITSYCPGITVTGDLAGTYDIEEYIAKVISNENDWAPNGNLENNKAQAVAARTYVLRRTNNCENTIENSTRNQTMAAVASNAAIAATNEVAGQVLVDAEGNYISTEYDAFCLDHSDDDNYYIVQKNVAIPKTWAQEQKIPTSYLTNVCGTDGDGGHGRGMSQWGSRYLSTQGYTYDQILYTFYDNATLKTLVSLSLGLETTDTGFIKRTSRALRDNAYFYNSEVSNEGECAWYAVRRTNEILANIGSATRVTRGGNGGDFCKASDYAQFDKVYDVNKLKPGMVISWSGGTYGHVAIIEDVHYDEKGNIESLDISEGSINSGTGYNTVYDGHVLRDTYIWNLSEGLYKNMIRQYTCEGSLNGSTGTGCQSFVNVPIDQIQTRWGSYKFICGIDLLS